MKKGKIFAVPKEANSVYKICRTCLWAETFVPRSDEKFSAGCTHKDWAGYVTLDGEMPCGGLAWASKNERR